MSRRVRHVVVAWCCCQWTTTLLLLLATITTMILPNKLTPICHAFRTTAIVGRSSHYDDCYFRHYNHHHHHCDGWYTKGGPSFAGMSPVIRQQQQRVSNPGVSHGRIHFRRSLKAKTTTSLASTNTAFSSLSLTSSSILVRSLFLRALAFVYAISFLVALRQNKALVGDFGITPAKRILDEAQVRGEFKRQRRWQWRKDGRDRITRSGMKMHPWWRKFYHLVAPIHYIRPWHWMSRWIDANPILIRIREIWWDRSDSSDRPVTTLLWLADERRTHLNTWLDSIAWTGLTLSVALAVTGAANVPCILAVWMLHRSLMAVGGPWYAFGWEPQLAELGFHSLFLVPLWSLDPWHPLPIPALVRWCIKWHLFRVRFWNAVG
jgi:Lipase maturation factor